jgi:membrane protease YdiL (CAAX protease family)
MDAIPTPASSDRLLVESAKLERPKDIFLYAFGWIVAAEVGAAIPAVFEGFVNGAMGTKHGVPSYISFPTALISTQAIYLYAAIHRAKIMAAASAAVSSAMGFTQIKRHWPIIVFGIFIALWIGAVSWAWIANPPPVPSAYAIDLRSALATGNWITVCLITLGMVVMSPIAEELFFRGWIWEGLKRYWRPVPVMLGTAVPWLLVHFLDIGRGTLYLFPLAICLSVARQLCGSTKATIALHALNNLIGVGAAVWFYKLS